MILEQHTPRRAPGARRDWSSLAADVRPHAAALSPEDRACLEPVLREDVLSEYDARFLSARIAASDLELSPEFRAAERVWAADEERHYRVTRQVFDEHWGLAPAVLTERRPNFAPLAELFDDELTLLVLLAYDELATVRAYRANLQLYAKLGPAYLRWARALVADEAWHYAAFLDVVRRVHGHRLAEASSHLDRVIALEGTPYAATFVLDHDDSVFTPEILTSAERALRRHLTSRAAQSHPGSEGT